MNNHEPFHTTVLFQDTDEVLPIYEAVLEDINPELKIQKTKMSDRFDVVINFNTSKEYQQFYDAITEKGINFKYVAPPL